MARWQKKMPWWLLGAGACVVFGIVLGQRALPSERVWREPSPAASAAPRLPSFRELVADVEAAVVSVRAILPERDPAHAPAAGADGHAITDPAAAVGPDRRNGSGFVVHERGLVLTSRHVVLGAARIEVYPPGHERIDADLVGQDPGSDLALLRLRSLPAELPCLAIGDSDELRAGDWIVAVGNPLGLSHTVTAGLVSFVGRHLLHSDLGITHDFLQISAPVNPGSSGGPVFDLQGRVVGVTTQLAASARGISFAVPARAVRWALDEMRRQPDGIVRRGYLGIEFAPRLDRDPAGRPLPGAVIVAVQPGAAAERAGLKPGDVVLAVDDEPIVDSRQLHERIVCSDPGAAIALRVLRDREVCAPIVAVLDEIGRRDPSDRGDAAN